MNAMTYRLQLLSACRLIADGQPVALGGRAQRLLTRIAVADGHQLRRSELAGDLWPDSTDGRAGANLRSTLCALRRVASIVRVSADTVMLADAVRIDWLQAVEAAEAILGGRTSVAPETALELWRHPLLPAWSQEWLAFEQLRFDELRLHALELLSERLSAQGRHGLAIQAGLTAIRDDPFRESSHRALVGSYLAQGNQAAAMQHYARFAHALRAELGVTPSWNITELKPVRV